MEKKGPAREKRSFLADMSSGTLSLARSPGAWVFLILMSISAYVGQNVSPTWVSERVPLDVIADDAGRLFYAAGGSQIYLETVSAYASSPLSPSALAECNRQGKAPAILEGYVSEQADSGLRYYRLEARHHWSFWSLLPALTAVLLCWLTREPVTSLFGGILSGAFVLKLYDITDGVLVPSLGTASAAGILLLYLWLLGGLMGVWSRTGAARAFAEMMTRHVVRGPRTAKLSAWILGVLFFQGGNISAVVVGTAVKPIADKEKISHEELAYIVDSTATPIASQLAFNAWPGYVQAFIYVAGVSWLATEADRITFFFKSVPFCFYAIFAVTGTFLLSIEKVPWLGKRMRQAIKRSRETGALDGPDAQPLSAAELQADTVPEGYLPHAADFLVPLLLVTGVSVGTFIVTGTPLVRQAFFAGLVVAMLMALIRGMSLIHLMEGINQGLKGVVFASVILLLAITIGGISKQTGGGIYLVALLGDSLPYWSLPVLLQIITLVIAFSTGTSWGTYAVTFPLAMPLAWAVAQSQGLDHPQFFMTLCFAAVMDGSVFGDQCSPISDTTVLSSMVTGCDLMDHVRTQLPQAVIAMVLAGICWTFSALFFA